MSVGAPAAAEAAAAMTDLQEEKKGWGGQTDEKEGYVGAAA